MIGLPSLHALDRTHGPRIWLAVEVTDMRCGFDRLAERVRAVIGQDPMSDSFFIFFPGHFERIHHVRKKYACAACESNGDNPRIKTAAKPETAIDKDLAGPGRRRT
jgi:transposase